MNRLILPLILAYVSAVYTYENPWKYGVVDRGVKELVVGDESELERRRNGEMPPLNPDGSAPKGYELYETFADARALRAKIPFHKYKDTEEQQIARHVARNKISRDIHIYYEQANRNLTELSDEKYNYYIVNSTSGEY